MHPVLLKFGPFTIYSYGLMVALGFALAAFLIYKRANSFGIDKDKMIDLAILILISGVLGARVLYVLLNLSYYRSNIFEIFDLSKGGLVWYGGFISALVLLVWYIRKKSMDFWNVADLIAPYAALAQGIGRIGCFLNGCCYGVAAPAGYPLAVIFPGESIARQPTQVYSSLALVLIFIILRLWQDRRRFAGEIFLGYLLLYSLKRFLAESLRGDNPGMLRGLTISQGFGVVVFIIAITVFALKAAKWKKRISGSK